MKKGPKTPKIAVFIDGANFEISLKQSGLWADYKKLIAWIKKQGVAKILRYYSPTFDTKGQGKFFAFIKKLGFKIVTKNIKTIKSRGTKKGKANFDVEITFDAAVRIGEYSKIILFSGDSDFAYLLFNLKKKGIVTSVVSTKWRTAKELMRVADLFAELKKCDFVKKRAPLRGRSRRSSDRKRRIAKRR